MTIHLNCSLIRKIILAVGSLLLLVYIAMACTHLSITIMQNQSTVYLCGTCDKPVTWDHKAVICDSRDQWYHIDCRDMHSGTYNILNEDSEIRWDCIVCNNPNYSSICFGLYSFETSSQHLLHQDSNLTSSFMSPDPTPVQVSPFFHHRPQEDSKRDRIILENTESELPVYQEETG